MSKLPSADLIWDPDGNPASAQFGDIYYSREDGIAETKHVFLEANGLPDRWQGEPSFTVGETGFGTGLNFLCAWDTWRKTSDGNQWLHYLSVEGFPLHRDDLSKALSLWPDLADLSDKLLSAYPALHRGTHQIVFAEDRVTLTLLMDDVLPALEGATTMVDAWFLDGFSPSQNSDMWTEKVFQQLARLSSPGASIATFTAAGAVRRALAAHGFDMQKVKGFGRKRDMLTGTMTTPPTMKDTAPWYQWGSQPEGDRVAVLGAGIAGTSLAYALRRCGKQVTLYDGQGVGQSASGNPRALFMPRLAADESADGRFHALAYLHMERFLSSLPKDVQTEIFDRRGVLQVAQSEAEEKRFEKLVEQHALPTDHLRLLTPEGASTLAGTGIEATALYFPRAGTLAPHVLTSFLAGDTPLIAQNVHRWENPSGPWHLIGERDEHLGEADQIILATGAEMRAMPSGRSLPIQPVRGQVTEVPAGSLPPCSPALVRGAYLITNSDGSALTGATFNPRAPLERVTTPTEEDHAANLSELAAAFPSLAGFLTGLNIDALKGRASYRAQVDDRIPMAGPLPDFDTYATVYHRLRHGDPYASYPPAPLSPGMFVLGALGARGFATALLLADCLAAHLSSTPLPLPQDLLHTVHPARFLIRALKKNKI